MFSRKVSNATTPVIPQVHKIQVTPLTPIDTGDKVVVKQPISLLKQKRKFGNKSDKPSVHFDTSQKIKDQNGNIIEQPVNWMTRPSIVPNAPVGLEYLKKLDFLLIDTSISSLVSKNQFVIKAEKDFDEFKIPDDKTTWNCNLNYLFRNNMGEQIYVAFEDSSKMENYTLIRVLDINEKEVMHITRQSKSCACCWCAGLCMSCSHQVIIEAPPGNRIGKIVQASTCWHPKHRAVNEDGVTVAEISGPNVMSDKNNKFLIKMSESNVEPGEFYFNASLPFKNSDKFSSYGIKFPLEIDVKTKAILIGAYFMIDYVFYENNVVIKSSQATAVKTQK